MDKDWCYICGRQATDTEQAKIAENLYGFPTLFSKGFEWVCENHSQSASEEGTP